MITAQILTGLFTLANLRSAALLFLRLVLTDFHSNLIVVFYTVTTVSHKNYITLILKNGHGGLERKTNLNKR